MKRVEKLEWFGCWKKLKSGAKKEWFFDHTVFFSRKREIVACKISKLANFLVTCGFQKQFFPIFVMRFDCAIVLILGWF